MGYTNPKTKVPPIMSSYHNLYPQYGNSTRTRFVLELIWPQLSVANQIGRGLFNWFSMDNTRSTPWMTWPLPPQDQLEATSEPHLNQIRLRSVIGGELARFLNGGLLIVNGISKGSVSLNFQPPLPTLNDYSASQTHFDFGRRNCLSESYNTY